MNPDSRTKVFRGLVGKKAGPLFKPACLFNQDAERTINLNKAGNLFIYVYRRYWQRSARGGIHDVKFNESNKESGASAGISDAIPAIFFKQLIENN